MDIVRPCIIVGCDFFRPSAKDADIMIRRRKDDTIFFGWCLLYFVMIPF